MRERGQASVEAVALIALALAVAAALLLGVVRFGRPLTAALVQALSGVVAPGPPADSRLDGLEQALLAGATSVDADGPTLLDVRTRLRSRLGRSAGDAAFALALRPLVASALPADARMDDVASLGVVDAAAEKAWLRTRFHPDLMVQGAGLLVSVAGPVGGAYSLAKSFGLVEGDQPDSIAPGNRAGDVLVALPLHRVIVLRRREGKGLSVIRDVHAIRQPERP